MSVLCIPAECDNIKLPIECEIASRWDAYLLCDICRHFASVMLHVASLISHNLRCIPAYTHQIPMGFFQSLQNNHRDNLYIISIFFRKISSFAFTIFFRFIKSSIICFLCITTHLINHLFNRFLDDVLQFRLIKSYCIFLSHIQFEISLLINIM